MARVRTALAMLAVVMGVIGFGLAHAAAPSCALPADLAVPHAEGPTDKDPQRLLPIGSYTLSAIWMPEKCRKGDAADCALYYRTLKTGRRDGLTLHGLWPDGRGKEWPQWCKPAAVLPQSVVAAHACATPAPQLIQHEWAKHGTCMVGYTPDRYFDLSNRLFADIKAPNLWAISRRRQTAASVAAAVAAANRGMTAEMMRLNIDKQGWLQEIWFCFDTAFKPEVCPATQGGARGDEKVLIWRGGRTGGARPRGFPRYGETRPQRYDRYAARGRY